MKWLNAVINRMFGRGEPRGKSTDETAGFDAAFEKGGSLSSRVKSNNDLLVSSTLLAYPFFMIGRPKIIKPFTYYQDIDTKK